ncbi:MAG: hypothetical protein V2I40_04685 [Desulfobacteraceae bacterium]|jgi:hypothetical protein|nr:hypothetical protein [Desulfobacteraceae bacterium]
MKQFYTVRDIEDMHAAGVVDIETHDDVVLTDVAREKAIALGMHLKPVAPATDGRQGPELPRMAVAAGTPKAPAGGAGLTSSAASSAPHAPSRSSIGEAAPDRIMRIKAAVVARLGTDKYNDLLDKIIPQVMSQIKK